jgi:nucleotide-binding universal stress UspA family protein
VGPYREGMSCERRVLVPLTGSPEPERVMSSVCGLVDEDATVIAAVVIEVSPLLPLDAELAEEEAGARLLLVRARTAADSCGVHCVSRIVRARKASGAILELAVEEDAEIVIVGSGGHHLRRSERQLLRKAPDRVLLVAA